MFERLRANYGDLDGVALENVAISDHDGRVPFHVLATGAEGDAPPIEGADMFGSLFARRGRGDRRGLPGAAAAASRRSRCRA